MAVVVWDETTFRGLYPQFANVSSEQLAVQFEAACAIVDNTENGIIPYDPDKGIQIRKIVLYALVCHLTTLQGWGANGQSGPLTNAAEGSVSVGFQAAQYRQGGDLATWLRQTPCGQTAWLLISRFAAGPRLYNVPHFHPYG